MPNSVLFLGRPGVGKTTVIREMARVLADDLRKRVVRGFLAFYATHPHQDAVHHWPLPCHILHDKSVNHDAAGHRGYLQ